jgi:signal transduction histidine kinase/CheY-like chemotaxis protein
MTLSSSVFAMRIIVREFATPLVTTHRNNILNADYRSMISSFEGQAGTIIKQFSLYDASNSNLFSVPPTSQDNELFLGTLAVPIYFNDTDSKVAATVVVKFSQTKLLFPAFCVWILAVTSILFVQKRINFMKEKQAAVESDLQKAQAIARTTQMLAHDVRKPFTMLQATLNMLHKASSIDDFQKIRKIALSNVQRAMSSVNGLLSDVMEIGSQSVPTVEETNPTTFIEASLSELFRIFHNADVTIEYSLTHTRSAMADTTKLTRVFSNILSNAMQAMNHKGILRISSRNVTENNRNFVEFALGNSGPHIPSADLAHIFDAFFTKNKKGGTGLGLAIAQRVVALHGGKISCESSQGNGVTFRFTIPAGNTLPPAPAISHPLPTSSAEFYAIQKQQELVETLSPLSSQTNIGALSAEVLRIAASLKRPISIHVVDDEALYRNAVASAISAELKPFVQVSTHQNANELWLASSEQTPDLIILDVDLGPASPSGFEIASQIRNRKLDTFVCIHTNRVMAADNRAALDAGANAFLPKPLSEVHLLKLLAQALEGANSNISDKTAAHQHQTKPERIAVVDDDAIILMAWEFANSNMPCDTFSSPEDFLSKIANNPKYADTISAVITDFHFDNSTLSGVEFAALVKASHPSLPIYLSTNAILPPDEIGPNIVAAIPKNAEQAVSFLLSEFSRNNRRAT